MVVVVSRLTVAMALALWSCQEARAELHIEQHVEPGKPFLVSDGTTYDAGERFQVNRQHRIPDDMVVQGDTVALKAVGDRLDRATPMRWRIVRGRGNPKLTVDPQDPRVARFVADGYGVNEIACEAMIGGHRVTRRAQVFVEFSTGNMLVSKEEIPLPPDVDRNPLVEPVDQQLTDHREQVTARNPKTGRLVTLWQVKFGGGDACPMGVGVMASDDHGITWKDKRYLYLHEGDNSGWGSLCWSPEGNDGEGEFLLWTCSHVRSPDNRIMRFRSRDDGRSWQHVNDDQQAIAKAFGQTNALLTYFGVNRTIHTSHGTLVAPMICHDYARAIWSEDDGQTWHASNLDGSFPQGNEDALVETIDGGKLILMARPTRGDHNRRFESTDGGKTWTAKPDTILPTARVNFGLDKVVEPGTPDHGRVVYSAAAARIGPHQGRQRLVVAVNGDPIHAAPDRWDVRLLWDASSNYSDVLYVPDDKSLLVTVETMHPGVTDYSYAAIRWFKLSLRYWHTLPPYAPAAR
ncbi:MAG TPA: sialidase family protein [Thermoguttaceae bacterium]|nr:sialidase family protein [Thermoguttaceae bacterium]